jgi:hypothetical protein
MLFRVILTYNIAVGKSDEFQLVLESCYCEITQSLKKYSKGRKNRLRDLRSSTAHRAIFSEGHSFDT